MLDKLYESWYKNFSPEESHRYNVVLTHYSSYYSGLSSSEKDRFRLRLHVTLKSLVFQTDGNFQIKEEMKIVIASAIVKLTFGLDQFLFKRFRTIFVAPRSYSYPNDNRLMAGDVNTISNIISLSWPAVERGFRVDNDADNIALHEASHCLMMENGRMNFFGNMLDPEKLMHWQRESSIELAAIRKGVSPFLDAYAGTNLMELFSVSVETLFEQAIDFKSNLPTLYDTLCQLLNQDPLKGANPVLNITS